MILKTYGRSLEDAYHDAELSQVHLPTSQPDVLTFTGNTVLLQLPQALTFSIILDSPSSSVHRLLGLVLQISVLWFF